MSRPAENCLVRSEPLGADHQCDQARLTVYGENHEAHAAIRTGVGVRWMNVGSVGDSGIASSHIGGPERDCLLSAFGVPGAEEPGERFFIPFLPGVQSPRMNDLHQGIEY